MSSTSESSLRLPIRFPPPPRQNLQTYLLTLGSANHVTPNQLFKVVTKALRVSTEEGIVVLRRMSGAPAETIAPLFVANGDPRRRWASVPGQAIGRLHVSTSIPVCPECLLDGAAADVSWCLTLCVGCVVHRRSLVSRCPDCERPLLFKRPSLAACVCGKDLSTISTERLTPEVLELLRLIFDACAPDRRLRDRFKQPADLPLSALLEFVLLLGKDDEARWGGNSSRSDANAPASIVARAATVLSQWPTGFDNFLESILVDGDGKEMPGHGGRLLTALSVCPPERLGPWHLMVLDRCLVVVDGRPYGVLEPRLLNYAPSASVRFVPAWEAAQIFGLSATAFAEVAERYGIVTRSVRRGPRIDKIYDVEGTRRAAELRAEEGRIRSTFSSGSKLIRMLGVGRETVEALAAVGRLRTQQIAGTVLYSSEDAQGLLHAFEGMASGRKGEAADLNMSHSCVKWPWIKTIALIEAVLSGQIPISKAVFSPRPKSSSRPHAGLNAYLLDSAATDILAMARRTHLTRAQAAQQTGIASGQVAELIRRGYLIEDKNNRTGSRNNPGITKASFDAFCEAYMETRELYRLFGTDKPIKQRARELGIIPVERFSSRFYLYDRKVVTAASVARSSDNEDSED